MKPVFGLNCKLFADVVDSLSNSGVVHLVANDHTDE